MNETRILPILTTYSNKDNVLYTRHKVVVNLIEYGAVFLVCPYSKRTYRLASDFGDRSKICPEYQNKQAISKFLVRLVHKIFEGYGQVSINKNDSCGHTYDFEENVFTSDTSNKMA